MREYAAVLPWALWGRYCLTGFVGLELPDVLALADREGEFVVLWVGLWVCGGGVCELVECLGL
ncbi:hypothetical protein GCM10010207_77760 [Streptomyces atratus]|nr:hypothetical protein GCM10010207_77760 [Streptomyces atratus]